MANVVVTDGLVGNVIVKLSEGIFSFITKYLKRQLTGGVRNKIALLLMLPAAVLALPGLALLWPSVGEIRKRVDWREVGGAPLLGVNGTVVIGHGRSDEKAIRSMIRMAEKTAQQNLVQVIASEMAQISLAKTEA
jgi:glycerol-3-phosphate acyltransferase PlsX